MRLHTDTIPLPRLDRRDIYEFSKACLADPWMKDLVGEWTEGLKGKFYGITTDGAKIEGLYELQDEGAPTKAAVRQASFSAALAMTEVLQLTIARLLLPIALWMR